MVMLCSISVTTSVHALTINDPKANEVLGQMFAELKKQSDPVAAKPIVNRIWREWRDSGSASIDLLMTRARQAVTKKDYGVAMDILDQVIALAPEYSEGWNRRATLNFTMRKFGRSLSDIEQVLAIEPRHFGALAGLATILRALGKERQSLETWYNVLSIYPANEAAQKSVIKLEEKLSGKPT